MSAVITVHHLGKAYKQYASKWSRLAEWLLPFAGPRHRMHWVLQDIALELKPGEALGIIGVNGAGKSTLLKMLTGTTSATTGSIKVKGRVAALLELGMGFHPEFTGRQNVLMSGQLLGLSADEIQVLMPEIEAFAGIGAYIDEPVRIYSSGMQVRLAFSIATAVRPDVLIVDEALSVGDIEFQQRSFERIRQFKEMGTALLFVSHDKGVITSLCNRALLLSQGQLVIEGEPEMVMDYYNAMLAKTTTQAISQTIGEDGKVQTESGSGQIKLLQARLLNTDGQAIEIAKVGQSILIEFKTQCVKAVQALVAGFMIKDRLGQVIYGTNTYYDQQVLHDVATGDCHTFTFSLSLQIAPGNYSISLALHANEAHISDNYLWRDRALFFTVVPDNEPVFVGASHLPTTIKVSRDV